MASEPDNKNTITLHVDGREYTGWTSVRITRGIDRMASDFDISVTEGWSGGVPWQIRPFSPCVVRIGADPVLTGYVDRYAPKYAGNAHTVQIRGRSKTEDIIDCSPEIDGSQFRGCKLDQIARAVAAPFGIDVDVLCDVGDKFVDATLEKTETGYAFIERLCRLRSILASDGADGHLVLARAASERAADALVQGENIISADAEFDVSKQFSKIIVRGQHGVCNTVDQVMTGVEGSAENTACPRYRPHAISAESQITRAAAQARARWKLLFDAARGRKAKIRVAGWRQSDGKLWTVNRLVPVKSPYLRLDQDLLISAVTYALSPTEGRTTELTLGPPDAFTPDPASVRARRPSGGGGDMWAAIRRNSGRYEEMP